MTQIEANIEASKNLLERAMNSPSQSIAFILIAAACRLDNTRNRETLESTWIQNWMIANKNRTKEGA